MEMGKCTTSCISNQPPGRRCLVDDEMKRLANEGLARRGDEGKEGEGGGGNVTLMFAS